MLFRLLALAYIDVEAKIAEIKSEIAAQLGQTAQLNRGSRIGCLA